ncbi:MAG: hypothetical protein JRE71_08710 [Deltaproteobacteria bacterium]|nr:hypothetical protein [Deltaproteobacteria bacterium]
MKVLCAAGYFLSGGLLLTILLSLPGVASAGGVGGYLEFWRGDQTIEFDVVDQDFTNNRFGLGVVLDTNVARNELLNVRATAGYLRTENTVDDEAHGGAFDLAVGFGLWRASDLRVWLAPVARIGVDYYKSSFAEVLDLGFGGGVRLGLNWHINRQISVSPSIAYQYMYVRETIKDDFGKDEFNGREQLITARLTFLFRDPADFF